MTTFIIALLITIILAMGFILWVDKAFFQACIAEIQSQEKTIAFLEEQVAVQQDAMQELHRQDELVEAQGDLLDYIPTYAPVSTPFLDSLTRGTVKKDGWHSREDTFQIPQS